MIHVFVWNLPCFFSAIKGSLGKKELQSYNPLNSGPNDADVAAQSPLLVDAAFSDDN